MDPAEARSENLPEVKTNSDSALFHEGMDDCDMKPGSPTTINVDPADGEKTVNQPDFVLIWSQPKNIQNNSPAKISLLL